MGTIHPVVGLLLLAVALAFPVEYRAGAGRPHPHAGPQVWWEHAVGQPHSHGPGEATGHAGHGADPDRPAPVAEPPTTVGAGAGAVGPDLPMVSDVSPVVDRIAVVGLGVLLLPPPAAGDVRRLTWPVPRRLAGRPARPEIPPPRAVVLAPTG